MGKVSAVAPTVVLLVNPSDTAEDQIQSLIRQLLRAFSQTRTDLARLDDGVAAITSGTIFGIDPLIVGHTSQVVVAGLTPSAEVVGTDASTSAIASLRFSANTGGAQIYGIKSRNATKGSHTIVNSGDVALAVVGFGSDGAVFQNAARIGFEIDGTPGSGDMPGRLVFSTTPDGSTAALEALRIDNAQKVIFQTDRAARFNNHTSAAAANVGTLNNAPAAGDPGHWLKINVGGTNYAIPCWAG